MSEPILSAEGLHVSYGRVQAVRDVSFEVPAGGLVTLVGANGAGKSSVLAAVSGLVRPKSGTVTYQGKDITRWPAHKRVAAGMVLVPEGRQILATLTVEENLQLGGWRNRKAVSAISQMYDLFPVLAERRRLLAGALSGGEQQMLAIGRAMVAAPKVVLMDEPSMGLAPKMVDEVFRVIETIRATGVTVVLVEQNARRALRAAVTGYVLETGTLAHSGPASELLKDPRVVKAYLGVELPQEYVDMKDFSGSALRCARVFGDVDRAAAQRPARRHRPQSVIRRSRRPVARAGRRHYDGSSHHSRSRPGPAVSQPEKPSETFNTRIFELPSLFPFTTFHGGICEAIQKCAPVSRPRIGALRYMTRETREGS